MANANVKPYEIIAGTVDVYFSPTGTAFPSVVGTVVGTAWLRVGFTEGGVRVGHPQTVVELRADQVTGPVKAVRSEEGLEISFDIVTLSLRNYAMALNRAIEGPDVGASNKSVPLYRGGFQVETLSLLLRNDHLSAEGDLPLQYEIPVCFQSGEPDVAYVKDDKAMLSCSFHAIVDPDRTSDEESFGRLRIRVP
jgi:hypothetical protein